MTLTVRKSCLNEPVKAGKEEGGSKTSQVLGVHSHVVPKSSAEFSFGCLGRTCGQGTQPVDERALELGPFPPVPPPSFLAYCFVHESVCIQGLPFTQTVRRELHAEEKDPAWESDPWTPL